ARPLARRHVQNGLRSFARTYGHDVLGAPGLPTVSADLRLDPVDVGVETLTCAGARVGDRNLDLERLSDPIRVRASEPYAAAYIGLVRERPHGDLVRQHAVFVA